MTKARKKVIEDMKLKDSRMKQDKRLAWRIRFYLNRTEYWIIAYNLPIALVIFLVTGDFWKALAFYAITQVYCLSANIRGLTTHLEGFIEWTINKTL